MVAVIALVGVSRGVGVAVTVGVNVGVGVFVGVIVAVGAGVGVEVGIGVGVSDGFTTVGVGICEEGIDAGGSTGPYCSVLAPSTAPWLLEFALGEPNLRGAPVGVKLFPPWKLYLEEKNTIPPKKAIIKTTEKITVNLG